MTEELTQALADLAEGQEQLLDFVTQLAAAARTAVPTQLLAHRQKLAKAKREIAKFT
jgi:hypothetical protein